MSEALLSASQTERTNVNRTSRNLVFLAFYYPPSPAIGGVRARNIAQSLSKLGWNVTVVTPTCEFWGSHKIEPSPNFKEVRVAGGLSFLADGAAFERKGLPQKIVAKLVQRIFYKMRLESTSLWARKAISAIENLDSNVDVLMTPMNPFFTGGVVAKLAEKLDVPFVLDYRDLMVGNAHGTLFEKNRRFVENESEWLENASLITTVSPSLSKVLARRVSQPKKCQPPFNGFDPKQFEGIQKDSKQTKPFRIVYAGTFYPPLRVIDPVFEALSKLKTALDWQFDYFGSWHKYVAEKASTYGITDRVNITPFVDRTRSLQEMANADLLVVITSIDPNSTLETRGVVTGKLFDSLALRNPVLLISPLDGDAATIVRETDSGIVCGGDEIDSIGQAILKVSKGADFTFKTLDYTWDSLGKKLDDMLKTATNQS